MRIIHLSTRRLHPCFTDVVIQQALTHDVIFIVLDPCDEPEYKISAAYKEDGLLYMHISVGNVVDFAAEPRLERAFERLLKAIKPDIVHMHVFSGVNVLALLRASANFPVHKVVTLHTHGFFCISGTCFDKLKVCMVSRLERCACECCKVTAKNQRISLQEYNSIRYKRLKEIVTRVDVIICCSHWQEKVIYDLVGEKAKLVVLYYGVQISRERIYKGTVNRSEIEAGGVRWQRLVKIVIQNGLGLLEDESTIRFIDSACKDADKMRKILGSNYKKLLDIISRPKRIPPRASVPSFGYLGTLWDLKGIEIILEAVKQLDQLNFQLLVAVKYDSNNPNDVSQMSKIQNCPHMKIMTNLNREDFFEKLFSQIDYLIIPSVWEETGPMPLFEAFYYKTPVIISNRTSMVEKTRAGLNALIFNDVKELGKIMKDIAERRIQQPTKSRKNFPVKTTKAYASILEKIYRKRDSLRALSEKV